MCSINERYFDLNSANEEDNCHDHYLQLTEEHVTKKSLSTKSHLRTLDEHYFKTIAQEKAMNV